MVRRMGKQAQPSTSPLLDSLRRTVIERPDDEAAALVYADALLDVGDPLGELIAAQCRNPNMPVSEEMYARVAGPLYRAGEAFGVRRGILRTIALRRLTPTKLRRLVGSPAWETVDAIEFRRGRRARSLPTGPVFDLVTHPNCSRVTQLYSLHIEGLVALLPVRRSYEIVHVEVDDHTVYPDVSEPVRVSIQQLVIGSFYPRDEPLDWLFAHGRRALDAAETLVLPTPLFEALDVLVIAPSTLRRVSSARAGATRTDDGWAVTVMPHDPGRPTMWEFTTLPQVVDAVVPLLRHADVPVASLTICGTNLGPEVGEAIQAAAPGIPVRLEWAGPVVELPGLSF